MERLEGILPFVSHLLMDALKTQTLQANVGQGCVPLSSDVKTFAEWQQIMSITETYHEIKSLLKLLLKMVFKRTVKWQLSRAHDMYYEPKAGNELAFWTWTFEGVSARHLVPKYL